MKQCEICGIKLAESIEGYNTHLKKFHGLKPNATALEFNSDMALETVKAILPIKTSNRSTFEITQSLEASLGKEHFIYPKPVVLVKKADPIESSYVSFYKNLGRIVVTH